MTRPWRWIGLATPIVVWALLGVTHRMANVRPGRLPSPESAVLLFLSGVMAWLVFGALFYGLSRLLGRHPVDARGLFAAWGLTQIPLGLEALGALMMLDPGWPQVFGYGLAVYSLFLGFPIGLIVFLKAAGLTPPAAVIAGVAGGYAWISRVWAPLVR